jgi:hypothetical protein
MGLDFENGFKMGVEFEENFEATENTLQNLKPQTPHEKEKVLALKLSTKIVKRSLTNSFKLNNIVGEKNVLIAINELLTELKREAQKIKDEIDDSKTPPHLYM